MTPKELKKFGETLFMSKYWKSFLMRKIEVSRPTVNRWVTGETAMNDVYEEKLLKVLVKQKEAVDKLVDYYVRKGKL